MNPDWDGVMKAKARKPKAPKVVLHRFVLRPEEVDAEIRRRVDALTDTDIMGLVECGAEHDWRDGQAQRLIRSRLLRALRIAARGEEEPHE